MQLASVSKLLTCSGRVVQVPTRVITRPKSSKCTTRGTPYTGRMSSYAVGRGAGAPFSAASWTMTTNETTGRFRCGCSIRLSAPGWSFRRNHTFAGRHY